MRIRINCNIENVDYELEYEKFVEGGVVNVSGTIYLPNHFDFSITWLTPKEATFVPEKTTAIVKDAIMTEVIFDIMKRANFEN